MIRMTAPIPMYMAHLPFVGRSRRVMDGRLDKGSISPLVVLLTEEPAEPGPEKAGEDGRATCDDRLHRDVVGGELGNPIG